MVEYVDWISALYTSMVIGLCTNYALLFHINKQGRVNDTSNVLVWHRQVFVILVIDLIQMVRSYISQQLPQFRILQLQRMFRFEMSSNIIHSPEAHVAPCSIFKLHLDGLGGGATISLERHDIAGQECRTVLVDRLLRCWSLGGSVVRGEMLSQVRQVGIRLAASFSRTDVRADLEMHHLVVCFQCECLIVSTTSTYEDIRIGSHSLEALAATFFGTWKRFSSFSALDPAQLWALAPIIRRHCRFAPLAFLRCLLLVTIRSRLHRQTLPVLPLLIMHLQMFLQPLSILEDPSTTFVMWADWRMCLMDMCLQQRPFGECRLLVVRGVRTGVPVG